MSTETKEQEIKNLDAKTNEQEIKNLDTETNETSTVNKKKKTKKLKSKLLLALLAIYILMQIFIFVNLLLGDWSGSTGESITFKINGDYIFCDTGAGSPVGDTDVRPKYIFIGFNTIITYGIGGIKPFFITKMTPTE